MSCKMEVFIAIIYTSRKTYVVCFTFYRHELYVGKCDFFWHAEVLAIGDQGDQPNRHIYFSYMYGCPGIFLGCGIFPEDKDVISLASFLKNLKKLILCCLNDDSLKYFVNFIFSTLNRETEFEMNRCM